MMEIVPRLHTLVESELDIDWYIIDCYQPFHLSVLEAFGIPIEKVIQPHAQLNLRCEQLVVPSYQFPNGCAELGDFLIQHHGSQPVPELGERIFIDRRNSRGLSNQEAFDGVLQDRGIRSCFMEDYSLQQQMGILQQASLVVALHGAGLSNLVFCNRGTQVVELTPNGRLSHCYPILSYVKGLHHCLIGTERGGWRRHLLKAPIDVLVAHLDDLESARDDWSQTAQTLHAA